MDGVLVESYAYDANGNRTTWSTDFGSGTATYDDQDRLLRYGQAEFTYTENGELLTKRVGGVTTSYTYDVFSNLRGVRLDTGIQLEYLVDPSNRRIATVVDGVVEKRFLYLGGLSPIAELDGAGAVTTQYVYHSRINVPDHFVRAGVVYRVFTDHLGSVRFVVRANDGAVVQRMEYDSFGRVVLDTAPGFQPFGFAGGLYDFRTGLVRFGARDYDAETGRWTSKDPIGFAGGDTSLYGYVFSDPVNGIDPIGLAQVTRESFDTCASIVQDWKLGFYEEAHEAIDQSDPVGAGISAVIGGVVGALGWLGCAGSHWPVLTEQEAHDLASGTAGLIVGRGAPRVVPRRLHRALPPPRGNANPIGEQGTFYVDPKGNAIPTPPGGRITGSPDGRFIQARDAAGNPTGVRIDGPHRPSTHPDSRAQQPHGHVPEVTNPDGTPWLPVNQ